MASTTVEKPKSPCRMRLEERRERQKRFAQRDLGKDLDIKLSLAEKARMELQSARMEKLHAHLSRVAEVVSSKAEQKCQKGANASEQLNDRLEKAQRRRELRVQTIRERLSSRLQLVDEKHSLIASIRVIQKWYRLVRRAIPAAAQALVAKKGIEALVQASNGMRTSTFEECSIALTDNKLLAASRDVVGALHAFTSKQTANKRQVDVTRLLTQRARTMLTANLIAHHPDHIFDDSSEDQCIQVQRAARLLLKRQAQLQSAMSRNKNYASRFLAYSSVFTKYSLDFQNWKREDAEKLVATMFEGYRQVYASHLETLYRVSKDITGANSPRDGRVEVSEGTEQQLLQVEKAIARMIGVQETKKRLREIRQVVKAEFLKVVAEMEDAESNASPSTSPPKTPLLSSSPPRVVLPPVGDSPKIAPQQPQADLNPSSANMVFTRNVLDNEMLAHELIINPKFQVTSNDSTLTNTLAEQMKTMMKKAFWDQTLEDFSASPPRLTRAVSLFAELKEKLISVSPSQKTLVGDVEVLLAQHKLKEVFLGDVNVGRVLQLCFDVLDVLSGMESPGRSDSTTEWKNNLRRLSPSAASDLGKLLRDYFEFVFEKVDLLQLDAINFNLRLLGPYLKLHGVEYEQRKFAEKLAANQTSLSATRDWIEMELHYQRTLARWPSLEQSLREGDASSFQAVIKLGIVSVIRNASMKLPLPETFSMDGGRFTLVRDSIDKIILKGSMLAIVRQALGHAAVKVALSDRGSAQLLSRLDILLEDVSVKIPDLSSEVSRFAQEEAAAAGKQISKDHEKIIQKQVEDLLLDTNPVYKLIASRMYDVISDSLLQEKLDEAALARFKLTPFISEVGKILSELLTLSRHNQAVHAAHYNALISQSFAKL